MGIGGFHKGIEFWGVIHKGWLGSSAMSYVCDLLLVGVSSEVRCGRTRGGVGMWAVGGLGVRGVQGRPNQCARWYFRVHASV